MFSPEAVRDRLRQQPFQPMQIVTTTGDTYDVAHPDMAWVGAEFVMVGRPSKVHPEFAELMTRISLFHITELRELPKPVIPNANGSTPN